MRVYTIIRPIAAAVALTLSATTAQALVLYTTNSATAGITGYSGGTGSTKSDGCLCVMSGGACPVAGSGNSPGTIDTVGGISFIPMTVTATGASTLSFMLTGAVNASGSIWEVTEVTSTGATIADMGHTTVVPYGTNGSGTVSLNIPTGTATYYFRVTDLLEQYMGATDTLPSYLGTTGENGGTVLLANEQFTISAPTIVTNTPEPASIALLVGGIAGLGTLRRRRAG